MLHEPAFAWLALPILGAAKTGCQAGRPAVLPAAPHHPHLHGPHGILHIGNVLIDLPLLLQALLVGPENTPWLAEYELMCRSVHYQRIQTCSHVRMTYHLDTEGTKFVTLRMIRLIKAFCS